MVTRAKEQLTKARKAKRVTAEVQKNLTDYITFLDAKVKTYLIHTYFQASFLSRFSRLKKDCKIKAPRIKILDCFR